MRTYPRQLLAVALCCAMATVLLGAAAPVEAPKPLDTVDAAFMETFYTEAEATFFVGVLRQAGVEAAAAMEPHVAPRFREAFPPTRATVRLLRKADRLDPPSLAEAVRRGQHAGRMIALDAKRAKLVNR